MSKFRKKEYELVAEIMRSIDITMRNSTWIEIERRFEEKFRNDNGRFKPEKFLRRCEEVGDEK